jgi:hypothetical protein
MQHHKTTVWYKCRNLCTLDYCEILKTVAEKGRIVYWYLPHHLYGSEDAVNMPKHRTMNTDTGTSWMSVVPLKHLPFYVIILLHPMRPGSWAKRLIKYRFAVISYRSSLLTYQPFRPNSKQQACPRVPRTFLQINLKMWLDDWKQLDQELLSAESDWNSLNIRCGVLLDTK